MKILLVEDNVNVGKGLVTTLQNYGYEVVYIDNFIDALCYVESGNNVFDMAIVDVMLHDDSGIDLHPFIQKPIIFLTAKDDEVTIVKCLEFGQYINKPFNINELIARIKNVTVNPVIKVKDLQFDSNKMEVKINDEIVNFSVIELKIINTLLMNLNKVITREYLLNKIFDFTGNDVNDNTLTVYLKRIRDKLSKYVDYEFITTIKGIGYRIDE